MGSLLFSLLDDWKMRFTPFKGWIGELKDPATLRADAMAGLTVALISIPQAMAYAQLGGLPPYIGLYASFLPVVLAALFGSSRQLSTGPVAMASLMSATAIQPYAAQGVDAIIAYSAMLALMIGVFRLTLGLLRLGVVVDFLSHPVVLGFTNAGALIIATSQTPKIFGLDVKADQFPHYYQFLWHTLISLPQAHLQTFAMGAFALASLFALKKYAPKLPGILITVVITTVVSWAANYPSLGGGVVGAIPSGLPRFVIPQVDLSFHNLSSLMVSAVVIGLMGLVEAISIAKAIASQTRQAWSVNQELVGQGLANITSGLFQGYVVSGSFSRSAVNFSSGARTGFASIITGGLVAITLLFLTDLLFYLPQATLGAVIIMAVLNLITVAPIKRAWRVERHDGLAAIVTFAATLTFAPHLEVGILSGILLSLGLFLYRTMRPRFVEVARHADGTMRDVNMHGLEISDTVAVFRFDGDLYFANTGYLEGKLLNNIASKPKLKVLVLDMGGVSHVDATGDAMLEKMVDRLRATGVEFYLARTKQTVYQAFQRSGLADHIGREHFFLERKHAVKHAKDKLGDAVDIDPFLTHSAA
ncbi:SulP family inorganic anion transporter [Candidatus Thiothrix sp. Deng01]|uniref:SulP family inorganic anion transporter n=1 Tax=Candidatus Thiothrix phosphatis TaxID=3112415 RepID=A0ABU6CZ14_9GAMM|nr:SulP family inorganic anion transporter [Candidatus Thiothrix sp. Deng01]MEB4591322.1 SulP family inorganic anion transporter [Candidatus Thiothrix sp. Deng01]